MTSVNGIGSAAPQETLADWPWVISAPTYLELIDARVALTPDVDFLIEGNGVHLTFADFRAKVERTAAALRGAGIGPGSRVAWQLPTRISTVVVMTALRRLGALQAPIIHLYREREVTAALVASRAEFFLLPGTWNNFDFVAMAQSLPLANPPQLIEIGHVAPELDDTSNVPPVPTDPQEIAWIFFTSGSTGKPKGAQHTDDTIISTAVTYTGCGRYGREPNEVGAAAFPIGHIGGLQYFGIALAAGFPLLLLESFVPLEALQKFRENRVTTTGGATPFYQAFVALAKAQPGVDVLPTLRIMKGGGAPCPPSLFGEVRDLLHAILAHDYGMTEVPMIAVACPDDPPERLMQTDGRVLPGNFVRLVRPDGTVCGPDESGEVQVRGRGVCKGYTDPIETELAFTSDGWFRTGDLARLYDGDVIEIVGRAKDLIIRKGENIAPQEIEEILSRHPLVAEVAVIGIPDADRGEEVCAVIVPAPGRLAPTLDDLSEFLVGAGLMRQKLPERIEIVDVLPRTGLAKVAKSVLREKFAQPAVAREG
ncbi:MAG: cyclohexanecarboxylate-CoA ligase [Pseudonocardiales bacterium]|nr:cyclohexanecarboxylate-CoA ligase [Pseudonocardiales bacterium]